MHVLKGEYYLSAVKLHKLRVHFSIDLQDIEKLTML